MLNLGLGLVAIYFGFKDELLLASAAILAGMILDALDGKLARRLDVYSEFGAKLDTKADYISFGIAPAIIIAQWLISLSISPFVSVLVGFLYYAAVHYRLRRFDRAGHSDFFEGLPSPTGAATVCIIIASSILGPFPFLLIGVSLLTSFLMVSTIPYPHLDKALRHPVLRRTKLPAFVFFIITLLKLIGVPLDFIAAPEIFSVFIVMYLTYPLYTTS
jgi:CDP-diacylglycerol--serine O-phosphatidyltransferase